MEYRSDGAKRGCGVLWYEHGITVCGTFSFGASNIYFDYGIVDRIWFIYHCPQKSVLINNARLGVFQFMLFIICAKFISISSLGKCMS